MDKGSAKIYVSVGKGREVGATWQGGAYVDLWFWGTEPTEVINVYDYATGTVDDRARSPKGLREIVRDWAKSQDEEWPDWHAEYVRNVRGF